MWDEIGRLAADDGLTILLTTHYLEEADRLASRLVIVDRGRIVAEGTPDELKGQLHGDAVHVRARRSRRTPVSCWPSWDGCRRSARSGWTARHVSARADEGARGPASRPRRARRRGPARARPRRWRARRSTTCTCATRAAVSPTPTSSPASTASNGGAR